MKITLYTTNCPKCRVLETKLKQKNIEFDVVDDENVMIEKGFMEAPMLEVDNNYKNYNESIKWLNELGVD